MFTQQNINAKSCLSPSTHDSTQQHHQCGDKDGTACQRSFKAFHITQQQQKIVLNSLSYQFHINTPIEPEMVTYANLAAISFVHFRKRVAL